MTRLALFLSFSLALSCCKEFNPTYCIAHKDDRCPGTNASNSTDAPPPGSCTDNADCKSASSPVCDVSSGEGVCVVCTATGHALCGDTTPVCIANSCEACRNNADCTLSDLCLATGACAAEGDVAYVDAAGIDNPDCTKALPCTKVASALATQTALAVARPYITIKGAISDGATISRNVTVFADPGASLTRLSSGAVVTVSGTAVVEIDDLTVTNSRGTGDAGIEIEGTAALTLKRVLVSKNKGHGILCGGASLTVSGSTLSENGAAGISCASGSLTVFGSTFTKNTGGGLVATGGSFDITNNFIHDNGDKLSSDVGGVVLNPAVGTMKRFAFNTVVDNHARDFINVPSAGVVCDVSGFTAPNNIIARNDINADPDNVNANIATAGRCTFPTSTIGASVTSLKFVSPDNDPRDYHLKVGSSAIDQATTASEVTVDADGDLRPQGAGKDQGADELKSGP